MNPIQGELFPLVSALAGEGNMQDAASRSIRALQEAGALDATHSLMVALIMEGARKLDQVFATDKLTIAANQMHARLLDATENFPTVQEAIDDRFTEITEALKNAD